MLMTPQRLLFKIDSLFLVTDKLSQSKNMAIVWLCRVWFSRLFGLSNAFISFFLSVPWKEPKAEIKKRGKVLVDDGFATVNSSAVGRQ